MGGGIVRGARFKFGFWIFVRFIDDVLKYSKTIRPRKEFAQKLSVLGRFALKKCLFEAVYVSNIARTDRKVKLWILGYDGVARRTDDCLAK